MIHISVDVESLLPLLVVCKDGRLVQLLLCPHSMMSPKRIQGLLDLSLPRVLGNLTHTQEN
jgi:hypothetical protein